MSKKKKIIVNEAPVVFESENNQLAGYLHSSGSKNIIILNHGFTGNKVESKRLFVEAAREFAKGGIDAFRYDFYGSGDSAGEFAETTLSHNIQNLKDAVVLMQQRDYEKIAVLGLSMGGATCILTVSDIPVDYMITWSAVPDMEKIFQEFGGDLSADSADVQDIVYNGWKVNRTFWEDGYKHDIQSAFQNIKIPKLVIQGTEDKQLFVDGFKAFRDLAYPPADFMEMPGAGHTFQTPAHRRQVIHQSYIWLKRKLAQLT
jgi:uncharacterized protein